ncbi:hypothetical protein Q8A67_013156 [Cirrhinus molitorella]|uniref:G-protein coupled receptors family 1 profile domain-containing protein n=1 Tax=Cirrhinus molitorella TaxID=172907 RepID=A0AA88PS80_9TELE|nr:hypothetical protein Q8A67_013156 [Cirrhinus molitorella]
MMLGLLSGAFMYPRARSRAKRCVRASRLTRAVEECTKSKELNLDKSDLARVRTEMVLIDENTTEIDYYYDTDYEDQLCRKEDVVKVGSIVIPIFLMMVVVLSCMGNILVLVILALYESLKSLTNVFILNLALSDLLFTSGLPFWASYYIWGWTFGEAGCKAVGVCDFVNYVPYEHKERHKANVCAAPQLHC